MLSRFLKIGNQGSALEDEQSSASFQNAQNFQHFDHAFKGELHTTSGPTFVSQFGECSYANRSVQVICKGTSFDIIEDVGISIRKSVQITYKQITALSWDHANSEVKIEIGDDELVILTMAISVEFEGEIKLRLKGMGSGVRLPPTTYIGMFAGATKPKPFQRKRPNLSTLAPSKLPPLHDMRSLAMQLHKGSYKPCPPGESRRMELATQHIYEGFNSFPLLFVRGHSVQNQWRHDSILQIKEEMLVFRPLGANIGNSVEFAFADISDWTAIDNDNHSSGDSGIEIKSNEGDIILFGVAFIRDVKHSLEFCWNNFQILNGGKVKLGSTHGRPIVTITTLSGEVPSPDAPRGLSEVVDQDGILVRPGARMVPRRSSVVSGVMGSNEPKVVPPENRDVKKHWHKVVMHQGWLLKKGGLGVGSNKSWIKRYFVLYNTSQGHILTYYSDFTECPLYTNERHQRNAVDLAKTTFIRPGSNKSDAVDTPAHCFDIVTTEREWTLCAESQENVQRWLKLLTRAVDEDVAILPDEDLLFKVKPKADHTGVLCLTDYSTTLRVSANGVSVCTPHTNGSQNSSTLSSMTGGNTTEREHFFWVYTDFYKWSLISQVGKLALLVNVFADSSFTLRNEYTFRNKEAIRLASAIEFFIEKFMSVMHIRLETTAGAFDDVVESIAVKRNNNKETVSAGLHDGGDFDHSAFEESSFAQPAEELDLLGLDFEEELAPVAPARSSTGYDNNNNNNNNSQYSGYSNNASAQQQQQQQQQLQQQQQQLQQQQQQKQQPSFNDDPFGDDPFSDNTPKNKPSAPASAMGSGSASNNVDPFGDEMFRGESAVQVSKSAGYSAVSDPFGDDPFGSSEPAPMSCPKNIPSDSYGGGERSPPVSYAQAFGGDPFGETEPVEQSAMKSGPSGAYDPFGETAAVAAPMPIMLGPRVAPSLTLEQLEQHAVWIQGALIAGGGPLYDDGVLQIASKIEVRGSQGRITFYYRSQSALQLSEFEVSIKDSAGLIRCQLSALPSSTLPSAGQTEQQLLVECMQPASPGPQLILTYIDQMLGKRSASIDLPIMVTTFNEPLALSGANFTARWDQLVTPGQEAQEVLSPPRPVIPQDIHRILTTALKFGHITGLPDESEFVIYGAASLRTGTLTPTGEKVTVGCLAKIEMNVQANAMRVTFRTLHPSATAALMATAKIALL